MANRNPSPYKGHPVKDWAAIREKLKADKDVAKGASGIAPPSNAFAPEVPADLPPLATPPPAPDTVAHDERKIPRNLFSGDTPRLVVMGANGSMDDPIPGYRLYWFNDPGGTGVRISQAKLSGWEFVERTEVIMQDNLAGNNDLGSHVSYVVNPNLTPPTRAYLMKKPKWLDQIHQDEREAIHLRIEGAMKSGTLGNKPQDRQYTAHAGSSLPPMEISSNLYRNKQGDANG